MHLTVLSPERTVYQGDADAIVAPAYDGQVGILARHAPFVTLLGRGPLTVRTGGGQESRFAVSGGFLQVAQGVVRVLAETVETG